MVRLGHLNALDLGICGDVDGYVLEVGSMAPCLEKRCEEPFGQADRVAVTAAGLVIASEGVVAECPAAGVAVCPDCGRSALVRTIPRSALSIPPAASYPPHCLQGSGYASIPAPPPLAPCLLP